MSNQTGRPVVVTTLHGGVFFGYLIDGTRKRVILQGGRNCLLWGPSMRGFVGLANAGPDKECRVGPAANMELFNITSILDATPEAVAAWERAPWVEEEHDHQ